MTMTSVSETSSYGRNFVFTSRPPKPYKHLTDRYCPADELQVDKGAHIVIALPPCQSQLLDNGGGDFL